MTYRPQMCCHCTSSRLSAHRLWVVVFERSGVHSFDTRACLLSIIGGRRDAGTAIVVYPPARNLLQQSSCPVSICKISLFYVVSGRDFGQSKDAKQDKVVFTFHFLSASATHGQHGSECGHMDRKGGLRPGRSYARSHPWDYPAM